MLLFEAQASQANLHPKLMVYHSDTSLPGCPGKKAIFQQYLPDRSTLNYSLRLRRHNKRLITKTSDLNDRDFIIRNIYKDLC